MPPESWLERYCGSKEEADRARADIRRREAEHLARCAAARAECAPAEERLLALCLGQLLTLREETRACRAELAALRADTSRLRTDLRAALRDELTRFFARPPTPGDGSWTATDGGPRP